MPSKQAIAWSELKVGAVLIVAIAIITAIIVLVLGTESPFAKRYTLYTYLPNIGGLRPGSIVMLEGVQAGKVDSFEFAEMDKGIRVKLRIQKKYQERIRTDSIAKLRSLGLLGDKYIEISQGTTDGVVLKEGEVIIGAPPVDLDQMIAKATHTFDNMSDTVENIKAITSDLQGGKGTMGHLFKDEQLYRNLNETLHKFNEGKGTMSSLLNDDTLYKELSTTAANLRKISERIEQGEGTAGRLISDKELGDSINRSAKSLEAVLGKVEKGEGSLGKLSADPALYNNLNQLASNLKPITEKINKGEGGIGQLVNDKQLYENSNKLLTELVMLVHDVREDPKKYLRIKFSVF